MPAKPKPLPINDLRQHFSYNGNTGRLTCKTTRTNRKIGEFAELPQRDGYWLVTLFGRRFLAHRVIWAIYHGCDPGAYIDHINRNRRDNRISNLRIASHAENTRNRPMNSNNTSGAKGVSFRKDNGQWRAFYNIERKRIWLGSFNSFEEAENASRKAREIAYGEFYNHL